MDSLYQYVQLSKININNYGILLWAPLEFHTPKEAQSLYEQRLAYTVSNDRQGLKSGVIPRKSQLFVF